MTTFTPGRGRWYLDDDHRGDAQAAAVRPVPTATFTLPDAPGLAFQSLGEAARYQAALARCQRLRDDLTAAEEHLRQLSYTAQWSLDAIWETEG